jgi:hypothetical protein
MDDRDLYTKAYHIAHIQAEDILNNTDYQPRHIKSL